MTVLIQLTTAGTDSGPYNLYSNVDGYTVAFASSIAKSVLLAGYTSSAVPTSTTIIRVMSTGTCTNYTDITIQVPGTTTTTTTLTPTTTTTTTPTPTTTTTTTSTPVESYPYTVATDYSTASVSEACSNYNASIKIILYAAENSPSSVTRFYTDAGLTTPYGGASGYYGYEDGTFPGTVYVGELSTSGVIVTVSVCP